MQEKLYPLLFQPQYEAVDTTAAATLLQQYLGETPPLPVDACLCWQLIDADQRQSYIANGPWQGRSLRAVVQEHAQLVVGRRQQPNDAFPLCACLRATARWQPLSVYPEQRGAAVPPNNKFWYCLGADAGAQVLAGIAPRTTRNQLVDHLEHVDVRQMFRVFPSRIGDAFFLPSGKLHCLSEGNLVWELAQHSQLPLRLTEWGQQSVPEDELAQARAAICFHDRGLARISQERGSSTISRKIPLVPHCPSFYIEELRVADYMFDRTNAASFHLLMVVYGNVSIETETGAVTLASGRIALLPAAMGDYRIHAESAPAQLLRILAPNLG